MPPTLITYKTVACDPTCFFVIRPLWGEEEEEAEADVISYHVADKADGDAGDDDVLVSQKAGDPGAEGGRVDKGDGGGEREVAVELDEAGEEYLQDEGAEDDEGDVGKDVEAAAEVHLAHVAGVGYREAEDVDEVEPHGEGFGLLAGVVILCGAAHKGEEGGPDGEGGEDEDEHGGREVVGEEGGGEVGHCGDDEGDGEGDED